MVNSEYYEVVFSKFLRTWGKSIVDFSQNLN